ncbi:MAG: hypothetical protein KAG94_00380 [Clostridiales bacterium]|nr:hypothetical protein [Clostridiales bacterium]
MMYLNKLLSITSERQPNFKNIEKILSNKVPDRPTLFEFFLNDKMYEQLSEKELKGKSFLQSNIIKMMAYRYAGFDYFTLSYPDGFLFSSNEHDTLESISLNETAIIKNEEDFLRYQWPDANNYDYSYIDNMKKSVPKGMKAIIYSPGGLLENTTQLLGYDNMCLLLFDDIDFFKKVVDKVGNTLYKFYENVMGNDLIGAAIVNDDWGFNTQTMINEKWMKQFIFPWQKKIVKLIHSYGKKAILHSCGQLENVMDDVINDMAFDAKHSFEDNILPIEQVIVEYGDKIAILGGIDLHYICTHNYQEIQHRARQLLTMTKKTGGYALGTGNSVPYYIEAEKYYAMILTALE